MIPKRFLLALFCLALPVTSWGAADCNALRNTAPDDTYKLKSADITECIHRGWDPPKSWIPDAGAGQSGAVGGGSGGIGVHTVQAPEAPPKKAGAPTSMNPNTLDFIGKLIGMLKQLAQQSGGGGGGATPVDTATACPISSDATGIFGKTRTLQTAAPMAITCGGAVPLTNYRVTMAKKPSGLAVTEQNKPFIWQYTAGTSKYTQVSGAAQPLPRFLCEWYRDDDDDLHKRPSSHPPYSMLPMGQMIVYNDQTPSLAIRLIQEIPDAESNPFSVDRTHELYLVLPIRNGTPYVPRDDRNGMDNCDIQTDFLKPYSALTAPNIFGDMIIDSSMQPGCEASPATCQQLAQSQDPVSVSSCEISTVYPKGTTATTSGGDVVCDGNMQYMVLDHPNLLFPPATTGSALPIEGRTASMIATTTGNSTAPARIVTTSNSVMHFNKSESIFTLPSGGILGLANGNRLTMRGPTTVYMNQLLIKMENGGEEITAGGTPVNSFAENSSFTISATLLPITLLISHDIIMPEGYAIPTAPGAIMRLPVVPPKE